MRPSSPRLPGTSPRVSLWFSVVSPNLEDELHRQSWLPKTSPSEAQPPQAWSKRGGGEQGEPSVRAGWGWGRGGLLTFRAPSRGQSHRDKGQERKGAGWARHPAVRRAWGLQCVWGGTCMPRSPWLGRGSLGSLRGDPLHVSVWTRKGLSWTSFVGGWEGTENANNLSWSNTALQMHLLRGTLGGKKVWFCSECVCVCVCVWHGYVQFSL